MLHHVLYCGTAWLLIWRDCPTQVILGILRGMDEHLLANLSAVVILARANYHIFYALDFAMLRSIAFDTAFMAILSIIMEAAFPGNVVVKFMATKDWILPVL